MDSHTTVLSFQNGLNNIDIIKKVVNRKQIIAGVTTHGAVCFSPGIIRHTGVGKTILGEINGKKSERVNNIVNIFNEADIKTIVSEDIIREIWIKAIINSSINPITTFFQCKNGYLLENPILEKFVENVCRESVKIANAYGVNQSVQEMIQKTKEVIRFTSENYSSMFQSFRRGRNTEIDSINGVLIDIGRTYDVDVPLNEILVSLVRTLSKQ